MDKLDKCYLEPCPQDSYKHIKMALPYNIGMGSFLLLCWDTNNKKKNMLGLSYAKLRRAWASYQPPVVYLAYMEAAHSWSWEKTFPGGWGWVVGSAENRASSAPIELGLGLSLTKRGQRNEETNWVTMSLLRWSLQLKSNRILSEVYRWHIKKRHRNTNKNFDCDDNHKYVVWSCLCCVLLCSWCDALSCCWCCAVLVSGVLVHLSKGH